MSDDTLEPLQELETLGADRQKCLWWLESFTSLNSLCVLCCVFRTGRNFGEVKKTRRLKILAIGLFYITTVRVFDPRRCFSSTFQG